MIRLIILEDSFDNRDVPVGTTFDSFPWSLRTHGRKWLSQEEKKRVRDTVSDFMQSAREGQIWRASGGFGSGSSTFEVIQYGDGLGLKWTGSMNRYKLNRKNVEEFIFQGVKLIDYKEEEPEEDNSDAITDAFRELGYTVASDGIYTIDIQDKSNPDITYSITVYTGLTNGIEIDAYENDAFIASYRFPTRGRKPTCYATSPENVYKIDSVLRNLSLDILNNKWEVV